MDRQAKKGNKKSQGDGEWNGLRVENPGETQPSTEMRRWEWAEGTSALLTRRLPGGQRPQAPSAGHGQPRNLPQEENTWAQGTRKVTEVL